MSQRRIMTTNDFRGLVQTKQDELSNSMLLIKSKMQVNFQILDNSVYDT